MAPGYTQDSDHNFTEDSDPKLNSYFYVFHYHELTI